MIRSRFYLPGVEDYRPTKWPPPGPYWCTGSAGLDVCPILVAYTETEDQITEFWPEAEQIDVHRTNCEPEFSDRFPQPDWWPVRGEKP